jgi:hypothetical protein
VKTESHGTRRVRRIAALGAVVAFLATLASTFVGELAGCERALVTNAAGVSAPGPLVCPPTVVLPLVLLGVFLVGWTATVVWAAARRRSGVEPDSTEVVLFPQ